MLIIYQSHYPFDPMKFTYKEAGVDVDKSSDVVSVIVERLKYKRKGFARPLELPGHFSGLIGFGDFALSMCTDSVGTKLLVARAMEKWETVGMDCIALNVNDVICVGAEPIAFVDYIAVDKLNEKIAEQIAVGLNEGAERANISVIGGELAVIPDIVKDFDLVGTCLGFVKKDDIITGQDINVGDFIIGLESSGLHNNGYTLARKIFESKGFSYHDLLPGTKKTIGDVLLEPTINYSSIVLEILKKFKIKGMANITGSGLRNLIRLKENVEFVITDGFEPQHIFKVIQELGEVSTEEMYQTFNMGMGFSLIVDENNVDEILRFIKKDIDAKVVGEVREGKGVSYPELNIKYERY